MPSADFGEVGRADGSALSPSEDTSPRSRGQRSDLPCIDAGLITHSPMGDGGLCGGVPARPGCPIPRIRFVFLAPHLGSTRLSDPTSGDALALPWSFGSTDTWTGDLHPQA